MNSSDIVIEKEVENKRRAAVTLRTALIAAEMDVKKMNIEIGVIVAKLEHMMMRRRLAEFTKLWYKGREFNKTFENCAMLVFEGCSRKSFAPMTGNYFLQWRMVFTEIREISSHMLNMDQMLVIMRNVKAQYPTRGGYISHDEWLEDMHDACACFLMTQKAFRLFRPVIVSLARQQQLHMHDPCLHHNDIEGKFRRLDEHGRLDVIHEPVEKPHVRNIQGICDMFDLEFGLGPSDGFCRTAVKPQYSRLIGNIGGSSPLSHGGREDIRKRVDTGTEMIMLRTDKLVTMLKVLEANLSALGQTRGNMPAHPSFTGSDDISDIEKAYQVDLYNLVHDILIPDIDALEVDMSRESFKIPYDPLHGWVQMVRRLKDDSTPCEWYEYADDDHELMKQIYAVISRLGSNYSDHDHIRNNISAEMVTAQLGLCIRQFEVKAGNRDWQAIYVANSPVYRLVRRLAGARYSYGLVRACGGFYGVMDQRDMNDPRQIRDLSAAVIRGDTSQMTLPYTTKERSHMAPLRTRIEGDEAEYFQSTSSLMNDVRAIIRVLKDHMASCHGHAMTTEDRVTSEILYGYFTHMHIVKTALERALSDRQCFLEPILANPELLAIFVGHESMTGGCRNDRLNVLGEEYVTIQTHVRYLITHLEMLDHHDVLCPYNMVQTRRQVSVLPVHENVINYAFTREKYYDISNGMKGSSLRSPEYSRNRSDMLELRYRLNSQSANGFVPDGDGDNVQLFPGMYTSGSTCKYPVPRSYCGEASIVKLDTIFYALDTGELPRCSTVLRHVSQINGQTMELRPLTPPFRLVPAETMMVMIMLYTSAVLVGVRTEDHRVIENQDGGEIFTYNADGEYRPYKILNVLAESGVQFEAETIDLEAYEQLSAMKAGRYRMCMKEGEAVYIKALKIMTQHSVNLNGGQCKRQSTHIIRFFPMDIQKKYNVLPPTVHALVTVRANSRMFVKNDRGGDKLYVPPFDNLMLAKIEVGARIHENLDGDPVITPMPDPVDWLLQVDQETSGMDCDREAYIYGPLRTHRFSSGTTILSSGHTAIRTTMLDAWASRVETPEIMDLFGGHDLARIVAVSDIQRLAVNVHLNAPSVIISRVRKGKFPLGQSARTTDERFYHSRN